MQKYRLITDLILKLFNILACPSYSTLCQCTMPHEIVRACCPSQYIFCIYLPDLTNTATSSILTNYIVHSSAANPHPLGSDPRAPVLCSPREFFGRTCNGTSVSIIMACSSLSHTRSVYHLLIPELWHRPLFRDRSSVFRSAQPSHTMRKAACYTYRQTNLRIRRPKIRLRQWSGGQRGGLTVQQMPPFHCVPSC